MRNFFILFLIGILFGFNLSCSRIKYQSEEQYNPEAQQIEKTTYSDHFALDTSAAEQQLQLHLVADLIKEALPISYQIKKHTRRLLPNDYMITSDVKLFLNNLGDEAIDFELLAVSIEHRQLPHSQRTVSLPAKTSQTLHLGRIPIDARLNSLYTTIEFIANDHQERVFDMKRVVHREKETPATQQTQSESGTIDETYPE